MGFPHFTATKSLMLGLGALYTMYTDLCFMLSSLVYLLFGMPSFFTFNVFGLGTRMPRHSAGVSVVCGGIGS